MAEKKFTVTLLNSLIDTIRQQLNEQLSPTYLEIIDEGHLHRGHPGAREGGHYAIEIAATAFKNKTLIDSHRLVYQALDSLMGTGGIHALKIKIKAK